MSDYPVTIATVLPVWAIAILTGSVVSGPSEALRDMVATGVPAFEAGRWWTPLTSMFFAPGIGGYLLATVLALLLLPAVERRNGSVRTASLLVLAPVVGSLLAVGVVTLGAELGSSWAQQLSRDTSVSAGAAILGAALAGTARFGALWRRRLRLLLLGWLVMAALYSGLFGDVLRLVVGVAGVLLGMLLWPDVDRRPRPRAPSTPEARALIALLVTVTALGPLLAALTHAPIGPLSVLREVVDPALPDLNEWRRVCAAPDQQARCRQLATSGRISGFGSALLDAVPALLSLVIAAGLRRGRRAAWVCAVVLQVSLAVLGVLLAVLVLRDPVERQVQLAPLWPSMPMVWVPAVVPALVAVVLVANRHRFEVRQAGVRRTVDAVVDVLLATSAVWLIGGLISRNGFVPPPNFLDLLIELPARFVPPGYLVAVSPRMLPASWAAVVVTEWIGVLCWLAVAVLLARLFLGRPHVGGQRGERARELVRIDPRSNLAQMVGWPGNDYWFTPAGDTAVAYRVVGSVALTLGGPFGASGTDAAAIGGFTAFCRDQGLVPCFYTITGPVERHCAAAGFDTVRIAEETVLPLRELSFTGKRWQHVRSALHRAERFGVIAEYSSFAELPSTLRTQIRAISEEWVASKGLPEMGFTLGGFDELADPGTRLLIAVDGDRRVHGVTSWLPVYRDERPVGWTLDFMRRADDAMPGVMEFLIASAALRFKGDGLEFLSLSAVPLAHRGSSERAEDSAALLRLLDRLADELEPVYGFRSLLAFKAKFQPDYHPLYLAYPEAAALPAVAYAIGHAHLPHLRPHQLAQLIRLRSEAKG
ncbi:bifunctional lysylphosphatidylglycerol flippase/synthetase MprF [Actinoalloteichus hymeniacidonis]|uniref:Phosphatidylglycerol lysyltransferase C-terminal domain-containing protein n=1 Tax=Actinoalloteichus hymeniacidonis TaxID=340345 RepID=A0AAC9MZQ6_9PSEU|nr:DUF2156 domain-containing protein [Actinoalloteichus hymeniacidonis]AOS64679.1 hypothetical protein TL08_19440 [Actinoalloteichus hymeniacidonis]MBB5907246.1 lysylphosphatidylglycerol synthetase-like protein (DUF2156 family) [Actinoalloteichus hymeniacidonis]